MNVTITPASHGLTFHGQDRLFEPEHPYLFRARNPDYALFFTIQKEMAQLNDFCIALLQARQIGKALQRSLQPAGTPVGPTESNLPNDQDVLLHFLGKDSFAYTQSEVHQLFGPASILVLAWAFLIKSLKDINKDINPSINPNNTKPLKMSEFDRELTSICTGLSSSSLRKTLDKERNLKKLLNSIRKGRNHFAHGDWGQLAILISNTPILDVFKTITHTIDLIQNEYIAWGDSRARTLA